MKINLRFLFITFILVLFSWLIIEILTNPAFPLSRPYPIENINKLFNLLYLKNDIVEDSTVYENHGNVMVSYKLENQKKNMNGWCIEIKDRYDFLSRQIDKIYQLLNEKEREIFDQYFAPLIVDENLYLFYEKSKEIHLAIYDQESDSLYYILVHK